MQNKKEYLDLITIYNNQNNEILKNLKTYYHLVTKTKLLNDNITILNNNLNLLINEIKFKLDYLEEDIINIIESNKSSFLYCIFQDYYDKKLIEKVNQFIVLRTEYIYCIHNKEKDINRLKDHIKNHINFIIIKDNKHLFNEKDVLQNLDRIKYELEFIINDYSCFITNVSKSKLDININLYIKELKEKLHFLNLKIYNEINMNEEIHNIILYNKEINELINTIKEQREIKNE